MIRALVIKQRPKASTLVIESAFRITRNDIKNYRVYREKKTYLKNLIDSLIRNIDIVSEKERLSNEIYKS